MMENRVRWLRRKLGWTQKKLADRSGVGRSTISNVETGKYIPRVDVAICIAQALGESTDDVFIVQNRRKSEK